MWRLVVGVIALFAAVVLFGPWFERVTRNWPWYLALGGEVVTAGIAGAIMGYKRTW